MKKGAPSMKTILWAALTANGNYAQSSPEHPPKKEALDDFASHVRKTGNFIVGRRTFEGFNANGAGNAIADTDIVVVSRNSLEIPGVTRAATPKEALDYLERRGHETALLVGGESLHNAFLAQDLVDELVFNITPTLESRGLNLLLGMGQYKDVQLLDYKDIGGGIVQLRYMVNR
jgi:dihydrofolate reductase